METNKENILKSSQPFILLGLGGLALWQVTKYFNKSREQKSIEASNQNILKHEINIKKNLEKINVTEQNAYVSGLNSLNKKVSVNIVNVCKEIINAFFIVFTDKNWIKKYILKSDSEIKNNSQIVLNSILNTPLKYLPLLEKIYSIYTNRNLLNDCQKLDYQTYTKIKAVINFAHQNKTKLNTLNDSYLSERMTKNKLNNYLKSYGVRLPHGYELVKRTRV